MYALKAGCVVILITMLGSGVLDMNNTLTMRTTALCVLVLLCVVGTAFLFVDKYARDYADVLKLVDNLKREMSELEKGVRNEHR